MFAIDPTVLEAFMLTASAIVMSPGPDTLIILRHTLGSGRSVELVTLAAVLIVINVIWQTPMAWAADSLRRWLATPGRQRAVSRVSGSVLLFFAALMLYENLF